jgi:transcriptional regulator with XRE-family HTH domain
MIEAQRLIRELKAKGWSTSAIGRGIGVTDESIRRWWSGKTRPENLTAVTMALRQLLDQPVPKRPYVRTARREKSKTDK